MEEQLQQITDVINTCVSNHERKEYRDKRDRYPQNSDTYNQYTKFVNYWNTVAELAQRSLRKLG
jgi:hypothetical protein